MAMTKDLYVCFSHLLTENHFLGGSETLGEVVLSSLVKVQ